jgi:hypothetical protein
LSLSLQGRREEMAALEARFTAYAAVPPAQNLSLSDAAESAYKGARDEVRASA